MTDLDAKFDRVRATLLPGRLGDDELLEVRRDGSAAVAVVQVNETPWKYGLVIDLTDTSREFYYDDIPVDSFDEWLDVLPANLMVAIGTGVTYWGARRECDDYIELRLSPSWPHDPGLESSSYLDDGTSVTVRDSAVGGRLTGLGAPHIRREQVSLTQDSPRSVIVELVRQAMVAASKNGHAIVTTDLEAPELAILGFTDVDGVRSAPTNLLGADAAAAQRLIDEDAPLVKRASRWWRRRRSFSTSTFME